MGRKRENRKQGVFKHIWGSHITENISSTEKKEKIILQSLGEERGGTAN